jgi:putative oxidoreductase
MTDLPPPDAERRPRLLIPALGCLYRPLSEPAETLLRVVAGAALVTHGWGKIQDPFAAAGMVEGLGFHPGEVWSLLLSLTEFAGGLCIAIGLLTRPAALAASFLLGVTAYFHWVVQAEGWAGAEKSVIWLAVMLFFVIRGSNRHSVDALIGRQF